MNERRVDMLLKRVRLTLAPAPRSSTALLLSVRFTSAGGSWRLDMTIIPRSTDDIERP